jgi:hypothetical protein
MQIESWQMKPAPHSQFGPWFKEQFGGAPSEIKRTRLRQRRDELRAALEQDDLEDALHAAWTAALYGWNARTKK